MTTAKADSKKVRKAFPKKPEKPRHTPTPIVGHVRQIAHLGESILRARAIQVAPKQFGSNKLMQLCADLEATCLEYNGAGISAPQIFDPTAVFMVWVRPNPRYPDIPKEEFMKTPIFMANPRIIHKSDQLIEGDEGCLSIPGMYGTVPRMSWVEVAWSDPLTGQFQIQEFSDFQAKVIQHEIGHLNGVLISDFWHPRSLRYVPPVSVKASE